MRHILWNAGTTSAQVMVNAILLFGLYGYLVRVLGIRSVGLWSLMLSGMTFATLITQGFANGVVKFVAKYCALNDFKTVSAIVQTTLLFASMVLGAVSASAYPLASWILKLLLPPDFLATAQAILPCVLFSLFTTALAMVLQAALTGLQKIDCCNYIETGGALGYVILAILLVPQRGLRGLAYALAIQSASLLLVSWVVLRRSLIDLPAFPRRWNAGLLREIGHYGLQFQAVTIAQAAREPVTKALLARFGGMSLTGYYDLAARWVFNARELLVQANQVLIPEIAHLCERKAAAISAVYRDSYRLLFYLSLPLFSALILLSPVASQFWLGRVEPVFVAFVALLAGGWLVNILCNPAYVVALGTGKLRGVAVGCIATAALNPLMGYFAGRYGGGVYIVATSTFSLAVGCIIVLIRYHRDQRFGFSLLLPGASTWLLAAAVCLVGLFLARLYLHAASPAAAWPLPHRTFLSIFASLLIMGLVAWRHPLRKRLMRAIS